MSYDSYAGRAAELISAMEAAQDNLKNKLGEDQALYILDMVRGMVFLEHLSISRNSRNTRLHPSLLQDYFPAYDKDIQEADTVTGKYCKVVIDLPAILLVDDLIDGLNYIGGDDGLSPFRGVRSRTELSSLLSHSIVGTDKGNIYAYRRPDNKVEVYGDSQLEDIMVTAAFEMPSRLPGVNWDTDRYPINNSLMKRVKELSVGLILNQVYATPADMLQDFQGRLDLLKLKVTPK